ncbi:hypothetical protein BU24DRAFT_464355 [Aaosphaeria arxii CBS 175.79]|uniref:Uncharacterized protein n=1 Tax=Aaosphaeria arxii CBS 175.79 TaxID=1450172 RepID=A0A6A5XL57_9PLEO|nr:uncharacterized protein BU24DRAFT_464355 [Aaosphaeria arxii CBS 175.79]KAF2013589.1 hypothetical protein BU24DRAFT_464355 [Aaosphaeria arxii CBS 175.79]
MLNNRKLQEREPAPSTDDLAFEHAVRKGSLLLKQMHGTDSVAGALLETPSDTVQSTFVNYSDLKTWGYNYGDFMECFDFEKSVPIKRALEGINVSDKKASEGGNNYASVWEHEFNYDIDGKTYPITGGRFDMILNPMDGVIVAWGSFSPAHRGAKQNPPVTILPALKLWSDIVFLEWQNFKKPRNLRYVFRYSIKNKNACSIISRALESANQVLQKWPGVTFDMSTREGRAILGSPNGAGVAFLLSQHKEQLGNKTITKVVVFQDEGDAKSRPPSLLFYVDDTEAIDDLDKVERKIGNANDAGH